MATTDLPCFNVDSAPYFGNIQEALDDCNRVGGGIVYIPGRPPGSSPRSVPLLVIRGFGDPDGTGTFGDNPVWLVGDGPDFTFLRVDGNHDLLEIHSGWCTVEGISFDGFPDAPFTSSGIVVGSRESTLTHSIAGTRITRCVIRSNAVAAIHLTGGPENTNPDLITDTAIIQTKLRFCPRTDGSLILAEYARRIRLDHCYLDDFNGYGVRLLHCDGVMLDNCTLDNDEPDTWSTSQPFLSAESSSNVFVNHCWFEEHLTATDYDYFIKIGDYCYGWSINSCIFTRALHTEPRAIQINTGTTTGVANKAIVIVNPLLDIAAGAPTGTNDINIVNRSADCTVVGGVVVGPILTDTYDIRVGPQEPYGVYANVENVLLGTAGRNRVPRVNAPNLSALPDPKAGDVVFDRQSSTLRVYGTDNVWRYVVTTDGP